MCILFFENIDIDFLSLEVDNELIELFLKIVIIFKIKSGHDRFSDDVLSEIVEPSFKFIMTWKFFNLTSFVIDVNILFFRIKVGFSPTIFVSFLQSLKDTNYNFDEFSEIFQILFLDYYFDALDLFLQSVPFKYIKLCEIFFVISLKFSKISEKIFHDFPFFKKLILHQFQIQI